MEERIEINKLGLYYCFILVQFAHYEKNQDGYYRMW